MQLPKSYSNKDIHIIYTHTHTHTYFSLRLSNLLTIQKKLFNMHLLLYQIQWSQCEPGCHFFYINSLSAFFRFHLVEWSHAEFPWYSHFSSAPDIVSFRACTAHKSNVYDRSKNEMQKKNQI